MLFFRSGGLSFRFSFSSDLVLELWSLNRFKQVLPHFKILLMYFLSVLGARFPGDARKATGNQFHSMADLF